MSSVIKEAAAEWFFPNVIVGYDKKGHPISNVEEDGTPKKNSFGFLLQPPTPNELADGKLDNAESMLACCVVDFKGDLSLQVNKEYEKKWLGIFKTDRKVWTKDHILELNKMSIEEVRKAILNHRHRICGELLQAIKFKVVIMLNGTHNEVKN